MTMKTYGKTENPTSRPESKPEKLAKILYGAIVRYVMAQNARIGEKNAKFELDSGRSRRVNMPSREFD